MARTVPGRQAVARRRAVPGVTGGTGDTGRHAHQPPSKGLFPMPPVTTELERELDRVLPSSTPRTTTSGGHQFRRAVILMLMTLVLPGSAQLVAGNKRVGRIALRIWGGVAVTLLLLLGLG